VETLTWRASATDTIDLLTADQGLIGTARWSALQRRFSCAPLVFFARPTTWKRCCRKKKTSQPPGTRTTHPQHHTPRLAEPQPSADCQRADDTPISAHGPPQPRTGPKYGSRHPTQAFQAACQHHARMPAVRVITGAHASRHRHPNTFRKQRSRSQTLRAAHQAGLEATNIAAAVSQLAPVQHDQPHATHPGNASHA